MTTDALKNIFDDTVALSHDLLFRKSAEYAPDADTLHNFKQAAELQSIDEISALGGMLAKHIISIYDMIRKHDTAGFPQDKWDEKILDTVNYMVLLRALLSETLPQKPKRDGLNGY